MAPSLLHPIPGAIVEYMEDNQLQTACVMEENQGKLRLFLPTRRELRLGLNRILPWIGPALPPDSSREDMVKALDKCREIRQKKAAGINIQEVWEISAGEIREAPASWFAELFETDPDIDAIAAYGRALLQAKTHFRFLNPDFLVYDAETVAKRVAEKEQRTQKETIAAEGTDFFKFLWEIASKKREKPAGDFEKTFLSDPAIAEKLEKFLFERMINPDLPKDDELWSRLIHSLPENPVLPVQLLEAWGKIPAHHNFWLDRADYSSSDNWWKKEEDSVSALLQPHLIEKSGLPICGLPFISIDGTHTTDIDDAFFLERTNSGYRLVLAFANPALFWPFDSAIDRKVSRRATSLYLPEQTLHMLPAILGEDVFSLLKEKDRPALCMEFDLNTNAQLLSFNPFLARIRLSANLRYDHVQSFLDSGVADQDNLSAHGERLIEADRLARLLEQRRIEQGAIIMIRPEPEIDLEGEGEDIIVKLEPEKPLYDARRIVSEMMVLASHAIANWALEKKIPLIHRTQKISVPKEYAGIWKKPEDLGRLAHILMPSILETEPGFHAALGVPRYAPITSPLRRYVDLANEAQINNFLLSGSARLDNENLTALLGQLSVDLQNASSVQKFRPRYWKLLHFKQQGDKKWWPAVITEENEYSASITLPDQGLFVRGRRKLFDERAHPGMEIMVRLGKINPLQNEIQILETMANE